MYISFNDKDRFWDNWNSSKKNEEKEKDKISLSFKHIDVRYVDTGLEKANRLRKSR